MTAPDDNRQDRAEAEIFSTDLQERARELLREGASLEAVVEGLKLSLGAVRHLARQIERERCPRTRASKRKPGRPDWALYDATAVTQARHRATAGADAETIAADIGLPLPVCAYIVKRAEYHKRRNAWIAARACGP